MSKAKLSGGGIRSNKNVNVKMRTGKRTLNDISLEAVVGLGTRTAYPKPDLVKAKPNDFVELGNARTNSVGVGGGRTIYKTGYQNCYGTPAKGEAGMQGTADRGSRAILGPPKSKV